MPSCYQMPRIGKGECLWGKFPTSRAARLTPAGLCQGFAMRSSPAGTLCALLIPAASAPEALRAPLALRTSPLRGHVLRALFGLAKGLYGLATPAASRGRGTALGGPRRGAGSRFRGRSPFLDCPSKPPIAAQSLDGGGLRPATVRPSPATGHANRPAIRHKWPAATGYAGLYSVRRTAPVFMPRCSSPKPRHRPAGRSLRGDFVRRLRRAEPSRKGEQA